MFLLFNKKLRNYPLTYLPNKHLHQVLKLQGDRSVFYVLEINALKFMPYNHRRFLKLFKLIEIKNGNLILFTKIFSTVI
jgi:hypothetical protein